MAAGNPTAQDNQAALARAVQTAQSGDFRGARAQAETALGNIDAAGETTPFHAFLGMVTARLGDFGAAISHLQQAHQNAPQDVTIACNLIAILMDQGRQEEALEVASADLAARDPSLRVARYRAFLAQNLERFPEAIAAYEQVLAKAPEDFECWNNLGNARAGSEDHEGAVEALERALAIDPRSAPTRINLANALQGVGKLDDAEAILVKLAEEHPQDWRAPYQLYFLHKAQMRQDDAVAQLEKAAKLDPGSADKQLKLGIEYGVLRLTAESEAAYRRTLSLNPQELDAYLGLAIQYEHTNREDMFAPLIAEARQAGIPAESLAFIEALEFRRLKQFEKGLERIEAVDPEVEPIRTAHIRATLLDRLGLTDEAFAAYLHANAMMEETPVEPLVMAAELRDKLSQDLARLTPEWRESWSRAEVTDAHADPVFLVGFPRSGTTLLDTILMGHPDTVVMEEQPPLNIVEEMIGGPEALANLDHADLARARARYFEEVRKIQPFEDGQTLIDKSPLFLYRLPLIKRLFPSAKIILALRHPCDVVLSCFMSNFRLNPAMSNFLRLEDAATFYDLCFSHWTKAHDLFAADVHEIVYEKLVEDVEAEVRPLIEWLGLEWDETLLDHTATARSRGLITTASYSQVAEPIYKRASGRWLRYREHLEPVFDALTPWAEKFGYGNPSQAAKDAEATA